MRLHFALKHGLDQALGKVPYGCRKDFLRRTLPVGKDRVDVPIGLFLERSGFRFSTCRAFDFRFGRVHRLTRVRDSNYPLDTKLLTLSFFPPEPVAKTCPDHGKAQPGQHDKMQKAGPPRRLLLSKTDTVQYKRQRFIGQTSQTCDRPFRSESRILT